MKTITFFRKKLNAFLLLFFIFSCKDNEVNLTQEFANSKKGKEKYSPLPGEETCQVSRASAEAALEEIRNFRKEAVNYSYYRDNKKSSPYMWMLIRVSDIGHEDAIKNFIVGIPVGIKWTWSPERLLPNRLHNADQRNDVEAFIREELVEKYENKTQDYYIYKCMGANIQKLREAAKQKLNEAFVDFLLTFESGKWKSEIKSKLKTSNDNLIALSNGAYDLIQDIPAIKKLFELYQIILLDYNPETQEYKDYLAKLYTFQEINDQAIWSNKNELFARQMLHKNTPEFRKTFEIIRKEEYSKEEGYENIEKDYEDLLNGLKNITPLELENQYDGLYGRASSLSSKREALINEASTSVSNNKGKQRAE